MYTLEQLEILKARLDELNCLKSRLGALNAPDMKFSVIIEVDSKKYSFRTTSRDKAFIDIIKNNYELQISHLENKINPITIIDTDAL